MLRKIDDWLADAAAAPAEAERCLEAAVAQASSLFHWQAILEAAHAVLAGDPPRLKAIHAGALAFAAESVEIWLYREVAVGQATLLGDLPAAGRTLDEGERALAVHADAQGYEWAVLAGGRRLALSDLAGARRCLERGRALSWERRDVENLGRVANAWTQLDRAEALALLERVEHAAAEWKKLEGVIYWWDALGVPASVHRLQERVVVEATSAGPPLEVARYAHLYAENPGIVERASARAEALASTFADWLGLAEFAQDRGAVPDLARRALDRASALAATELDRSRVACASFAWFDDEATALGLGPLGVPPELLPAEGAPLDGWPSSPSALLEWLRARVTPGELTLISQADYASDAAKHRRALELICETGRVPPELSWHPKEVAALTRWAPTEGVGPAGRALCCVLAMLADSEDSLCNTGAILALCGAELGEEGLAAAAELAAWYLRARGDEPEAWPVALFLLLVLSAARGLPESRLSELGAELEDSLRGRPRALVELLAEGVCAGEWQEVLDRVLIPRRDTSPTVARWLARLS